MGRNDDISKADGYDPGVTLFQDADAEMNAAMEKARETVDTFVKAIKRRDGSRTRISVKAAFKDENGGEYMWINRVSYHDGIFLGRLANTPSTVKSVRLGDPVELPKEEVADWMYVEDGRLVGGFTLRVIRDRLPPEERAKLDRSYEFTFE